ncbi:transmembrane protein 6/97 [Lentinula lateritia]|uniref:Transmembrane protein 6/97 n=1 Tax=Lentinula aff. lateritia TaxID=2804960 RepID=A0ACC1TP79_9AGAR|nr:transmembrane protein 6/97 [Lentinula aff. lateritia]KAJ3847973.1 transmembrane protein 6/97 [Lentinula lateritia]
MARIPLTSRPLDFVYFCFFLNHIPASILLDFQKFYPKAYVPTLILRMRQWWINISADPLVAAAARGDDLLHGELVWFGCFAWLELLFQFPVFILGMRGLWNGSRSIYVLMLAYGASTATTVLPCIVYFLQERHNMTSSQRLMLLSSYVPFFLVPLLMAVDMGFRVYNIVSYIEVKGKTE